MAAAFVGNPVKQSATLAARIAAATAIAVAASACVAKPTANDNATEQIHSLFTLDNSLTSVFEMWNR